MTSGSLLEMSTSRSHPRPTKSQFTFEYYIQVINVHIKILEAPNNLFWQDVSFCEAILYCLTFFLKHTRNFNPFYSKLLLIHFCYYFFNSCLRLLKFGSFIAIYNLTGEWKVADTCFFLGRFWPQTNLVYSEHIQWIFGVGFM